MDMKGEKKPESYLEKSTLLALRTNGPKISTLALLTKKEKVTLYPRMSSTLEDRVED